MRGTTDYGIELTDESIAPLLEKVTELAAEWDAHYDELQAGLDALECPACGHEMRLWRVDDETMWRCMRRWREEGILMMCTEVVEFD